jgi:hypothetical protein
MLSPFIQLTQANMQLLGSTCGPGAASSRNPMQVSALLAQGMATNYVAFLTALGQGGMALFAAGRGGVVTLAHEL